MFGRVIINNKLMAKKNALGKGLGALLQDAAEEIKPRGGSGSSMQEELKLSDIRPNPHQPRTSFDEEALNELAASIKSIGIVQPITVREIGDGKYEIIAGERRYRHPRLPDWRPFRLIFGKRRKIRYWNWL